MAGLVADAFVQKADGTCWARVRTPDGSEWRQITPEQLLAAARKLDQKQGVCTS